jgi:hypothetical protein
MTHSKLAPSASARWLNCPGSVEAIASLNLEELSSPHADEGTNVHTLCEHYLLGVFDNPFDLIGTQYKGDASLFEVTPEIAENVEAWKSYIYEYLKESDPVCAEYKVPLFYADGDTGTADCVGYSVDNQVLHVFDYKNGKGVHVPIEGNTQLRCYGVSAYDAFELVYDIKSVMIHIVQPNKGNFGSESLSLEEIEEFRKSTCKQSGLIKSGKKVPRIAGEKQCFWCDFKHQCKEYQQFNLDLIGMDFDDLTDPESGPKPDVADLEAERLRLIYSKKDMITKWLSAVEGRIFAMLSENPKSVPGLKLVEGRSQRCWAPDSEEELVKLFRSCKLKKDEYLPTKLISAAQAEKLIKSKKSKSTPKHIERLNALVVRTTPKLSIVDESDKRPAVAPVVDDFDVL